MGTSGSAVRPKNVEVTIADMPGRKMGEEYRTDGGIEFDPAEDWAARADVIPQALETAIRKKGAKRYASGIWLVIYLNLNDYGIRQTQTELIIAQVKQKHASAFDAPFVLWKDKLTDLYPVLRMGISPAANRARRPAAMNDIQLLSEVGQALYGENWQSALSADIAVSDRSMRRWANGTDQIPWGV
jgi:hypothetical protein